MMRGDNREKTYKLIRIPADIEMIGLMNRQPPLIKELTFKTTSYTRCDFNKIFWSVE